MCANIIERTIFAFGTLCVADVSSEKDHPVTVVRLFFGGNYSGKNAFDFQRVFETLAVKSEFSVDSYTVCVRNDSGYSVYIAKDKIGNFSSDSRQSKKVVHVVGNPTVIFFRDYF